MKKIIRLLMLLSVVSSNTYADATRPIVEIETGSLQGTTEYNMRVFKNIPYAAPPLRDLR